MAKKTFLTRKSNLPVSVFSAYKSTSTLVLCSKSTALEAFSEGGLAVPVMAHSPPRPRGGLPTCLSSACTAPGFCIPRPSCPSASACLPPDPSPPLPPSPAHSQARVASTSREAGRRAGCRSTRSCRQSTEGTGGVKT